MQCTAPPPDPGTADAPTGEQLAAELSGQLRLDELPGWTARPSRARAGSTCARGTRTDEGAAPA